LQTGISRTAAQLKDMLRNSKTALSGNGNMVEQPKFKRGKSL